MAMDIVFHCPHCGQELEADISGAGQLINCPTCNKELTIPQPDPTNLKIGNPIATSAAARIEKKQYKVPIRDGKANEPLIQQKKIEDESTGEKKLRVKIIRHSDCIEVGVDKYEQVVSDFLNKIGEENIISITPLTYTHIDLATQRLMTDYAIQIIYRK